jgi:16S rRNA (uracil1498-N3)-methyltransferase
MNRRFHDDQTFQVDTACELGPGPSHHIARVLRMDAGDEVVVFNGRGGEWSAVIESVHKKAVTIRPLAFHDIERRPGIDVHLAMPMIKGERMDYALQKAVEMGAASVSLLRLQRNEVRLDDQRMERKRAHWHGVLSSACEQCGLNRVPPLQGPLTLADRLAAPAPGPGLVADARGQGVAGVEPGEAAAVTLITGPEGGLTDAELAECRQAGFRAVALGTRTLRAETAPLALMAALLTSNDAW